MVNSFECKPNIVNHHQDLCWFFFMRNVVRGNQKYFHHIKLVCLQLLWLWDEWILYVRLIIHLEMFIAFISPILFLIHFYPVFLPHSNYFWYHSHYQFSALIFAILYYLLYFPYALFMMSQQSSSFHVSPLLFSIKKYIRFYSKKPS